MSKTRNWQKGWSRRQFLSHVGMVGGASALYEVMVTLNMIPVPGQWEGPPKLSKQHGIGKSVIILGAGIGGLTAAYLLTQYGYRVEILEASSRAGGRNHTARRGTTLIEESKEHGRTLQQCKFDSGLYMNLGPGRLPYHHRRVLSYCQELDVKLEPYIMNTTGNLVQTGDQEPAVYGQLKNDARGYISELLAKAVNKGALDDELSESDQEKLLSLLESFGALDAPNRRKGEGPIDAHVYQGTTRDGCGLDPNGQPTPNVFYNCDEPEKMPLDQLLDHDFWQASFYDTMEFEWQPTLFQPVGGMDMIVEGFLRQVGHLITYNAPVVEIEVDKDCVTVVYEDGLEKRKKKADYCVSNIPCPVLKDIKNNFKSDFGKAVERTTFDPSCKVGWQCNTRFWESDKYQIYGGISWTDDIIEQIWYPSNDYFSQKGTLTGAYVHGENAAKFGELSLSQRIKRAKEGGAKIHPEFLDNTIVPSELAMSIAWQHIPYLAGAWPSWGDAVHDDSDYERLLLPDRRFYIVGDQASTLPGWQEGAMMSAEHVVELIGELKPAVIPPGLKAPNTLKVTQGVRGF